MDRDATNVIYREKPLLTNAELNELFQVSWPNHVPRNFSHVLDRSLTYLAAFAGESLVGFVNVAWDGGLHAFLLDTTVHPQFRRRGIGQMLVRRAAAIVREHQVEWLHVDFEPHLRNFYRRCGFQQTEAGLMNLSHESLTRKMPWS